MTRQSRHASWFPTSFLLLLVLCASARPAAASERNHEKHYQAGLKAFAAEDYTQAAADFAASMQVRPEASTALYLGNAYLKLGDLGKSIESFKQVLQISPTTPKRNEIIKLIQGIEARNVGFVALTSKPPGAAIYLREKNARMYGKTPLELSLPPGTYLLSAELEGYEVATQEVKVTFGDTVAADLALRASGCDLLVMATPPGSRAAVDGAGAVVVPSQVPVLRGDHRVAFSAKGYVTQERTVRCVGTSPRELLRSEVQLARPNRYALKVALGLTAVAVLSEGIALAVHSRAGTLVPDSPSYDSNHKVELGLHVAAGALAAGAVVGYLVELVPKRAAAVPSGPLPVRLDAVPLSQGGALLLSGGF